MDSDIDWPMGPWSIDPDPHGPVKIRSPGRWPDTARSAAQASGADDSSVAAFPPAFTRSEDARQAFMTPDRRFRFGFTPGCMAAIESRSSSGRLGRAARGVRPTAGATNRYVTSGYPDQSTMGPQWVRRGRADATKKPAEAGFYLLPPATVLAASISAWARAA